KDVIQQLKEYLATNKPKLQQFKEFLGLRDDDDDKEIEEEEEEEELQASKQHSRNVKVLTFVELTTQYTKDELDQSYDLCIGHGICSVLKDGDEYQDNHDQILSDLITTC
ncbi:hypothetical protein Tco_1249513, partial [Tanacetum coccineum]